MSTELTRLSHTAAVRDQRRQAAAVRAAQMPAKLAAARMQGAAFAAHTGLICTEVLSALEVQAVQRQGAVLDARAKAIVDTYAGLVTTELARLSLEG